MRLRLENQGLIPRQKATIGVDGKMRTQVTKDVVDVPADDVCLGPGIYIIRTVGPIDLVKIGFSRTIYRRLIDLSKILPIDFDIVGIIPGYTISDERRIHELFSEQNVKGEWFSPTDDMMDHLRSLAKPTSLDMALHRMRS